MATAGGTPPTGVTPKPKRELTPIQKFGLPIAGVLALIVGFTVVKPMLFPDNSSAPPATSPPAAPSAATSAAPAAPKTAAASVPASPSATPASAVPIAFVARARTDPFEPVLLYPPAPKPVATIKPKPILPLVLIPAPSDFPQRNPISIANPRIGAEVAQPLGLGSPTLSRTLAGAPRDAFPLPRTSGAGDAGAPQQAYDKRLAGVIIGDGVHALLEITAGGQITTQVVQPGDEVNGVRVLSIERFRDGERTITRMLVRDTDGIQRYVELKPSAQPPAGAGAGAGGAAGGPPGAAGFPGGGG